MWYPVSSEVTSEPLTMGDALAQVLEDQPEFNTSISMLISSARAHAEMYCNRLFAAHSMIWTCDGFADFSRLPAAPAISIVSISYVDPEGEEQTLDEAVYELRADGLEPSIALKVGQSWPRTARGSRVRLTGEFGGQCPGDVKHAMLLMVGDGFTDRENASRPLWTTLDALLSNHRRGAW